MPMQNKTSQTNQNGNVSPQLNRLMGDPEVVADRFARDFTRRADHLNTIRPALVVCLGGTGQLIAANLKAFLTARFGSQWRQKIRLLAFDTTQETEAITWEDTLITLEPGAEFFHVGNVPTSSILRNLDQHAAVAERLGGITDRLPAMALRNGAKMIRPLGALALLWHYPLLSEQIGQAIWELAGRDVNTAQNANQQQGINVFICSGLGGGTGSGMFLDIAYLTRAFFEELGTHAQFCQITGVGILPQAFRKVTGKNLYANTGAALQELTHLMANGGFTARYPGKRTIETPEPPFQLFYVLDGVDERGQTWAGIQDVAAMAAEGIFLQMASQLGRERENAFDNVSQVLINYAADGERTCLASYGLGYLEFHAPEAATLCAHWLLLQLAREQWLHSADAKQAIREAASRLQASSGAQLLSVLMRDPQTGGELHLDLQQPGWLMEKRPDEVAAAAAQYISDYGHARVNEDIRGQIRQNAAALAVQGQAAWQEWANSRLFAPGASIPFVTGVLREAQRQLAGWANNARRRLKEVEDSQVEQAQSVTQLEAAVAAAASGFFVGREGRMREALSRYFQAAQQRFELQIQHGQLQGQLHVWHELSTYLERLSRDTQALADRLETLCNQLETVAGGIAAKLQQGGIASLSLADEPYLRQLYARHAPAQVNLLTLPGLTVTDEHGAERRLQPLDLTQLSTQMLTERLLLALTEPFAAVAQMAVEDVIQARINEMSVQARRDHLFRLATPSWSIDFARLPEGGAGLERIEVLGVPDAANTNFNNEAMRVSTYDPHRITALVVVAGAPRSALQQFDRYQQALESARAHLPVYVLPQFMADAKQGKLAFALGTIFQLIHSQGTYFYYQPSDPLAKAMQLSNGLANALRTLENDEDLAREILERADRQVAQLGLQQAIAILAEYYAVAPEEQGKLDDITRELKQLVRRYTDELRQIQELQEHVKRPVH